MNPVKTRYLTNANLCPSVLASLVFSSLLALPTANAEEDENDLFKADFRLRYEAVDQNNALKDAEALTLRTTIGLRTPKILGFSFYIEGEDSRPVFGIDDYNDTLGMNPDYSVIADPKTTEFDQGYLQFKTKNMTTRLGRQVVNLDNQRFVGSVGWRQDKQTFDAFSFAWTLLDSFTVNYTYIDQRNRIFADEQDLDSKDHLVNLSWDTGLGTLIGYGYLLQEDEGVRNNNDTYGIRYQGQLKALGQQWLLNAEYAEQTLETELCSFKPDYYLVEAGIHFSALTFMLGYESLGSDDGQAGFATPLATLHKFNGFTDQFLTTPDQGLNDWYASVGGSLFSGKWGLGYHDFEADESAPLVDDFGKEYNAQYTYEFGNHFSAGVKYANYDRGDLVSGKVDTDKFWVWLGATF
ncbi:alginate export family protein [Thalassotalea litorea]|uniref:alginate export family protein n=1 Tax=Thalassotalea litorea TaxID=2020715 RepID=UPI003736256B